MRREVLALVIILVVSSLAKAQDAGGNGAHPSSISSSNTAFAVQGDFEGEYRVYSHHIELRVTKPDVRVSEHRQIKTPAESVDENINRRFTRNFDDTRLELCPLMRTPNLCRSMKHSRPQ